MPSQSDRANGFAADRSVRTPARRDEHERIDDTPGTRLTRRADRAVSLMPVCLLNRLSGAVPMTRPDNTRHDTERPGSRVKLLRRAMSFGILRLLTTLSGDRSSPVKVSNDGTTAVSCPAKVNSSIRLRCTLLLKTVCGPRRGPPRWPSGPSRPLRSTRRGGEDRARQLHGRCDSGVHYGAIGRSKAYCFTVG